MSIEQSTDCIAPLCGILFNHPQETTSGRIAASERSLEKIIENLFSWPEEQLLVLRRTAHDHHVLVRACQILRASALTSGNNKLRDWCDESLSSEHERISHALQVLAGVCDALETAGAPVAVIKSLDHWPDLGSDLDLYTSCDSELVVHVMQRQFKAKLEDRSWGDRLAGKWNFRLPGLPELFEIHVRRLGQTGEHRFLAQRIIDRRIVKTIGNFRFYIPACEERVIISTLQRMYRHFYFRLCDIVDFSALLQENVIDFTELRHAADVARIWPGVASFLFLLSRYAEENGASVPLPPEVIASVSSTQIRLYPQGGFLRVPKRSAAKLFRSELVRAGLAGDLRAALRLSLLPPLAVSALVAFRLTGNDKGIW